MHQCGQSMRVEGGGSALTPLEAVGKVVVGSAPSPPVQGPPPYASKWRHNRGVPFRRHSRRWGRPPCPPEGAPTPLDHIKQQCAATSTTSCPANESTRLGSSARRWHCSALTEESSVATSGLRSDMARRSPSSLSLNISECTRLNRDPSPSARMNQDQHRP